MRTLELAGMLVCLVDAGQLVVETTPTAPARLLAAVRDQRTAIIELIWATYAQLWQQCHPGEEPAAGVAELTALTLCLGVDLPESELITRLEGSRVLQRVGSGPTALLYAAADLKERAEALGAWRAHVPPLT